jgi:hypothetical protein
MTTFYRRLRQVFFPWIDRNAREWQARRDETDKLSLEQARAHAIGLIGRTFRFELAARSLEAPCGDPHVQALLDRYTWLDSTDVRIDRALLSRRETLNGTWWSFGTGGGGHTELLVREGDAAVFEDDHLGDQPLRVAASVYHLMVDQGRELDDVALPAPEPDRT